MGLFDQRSLVVQCLALAVALSALGCAPFTAPAPGPPDMTEPHPLIIAHRGASGHRPEHTLEAYTLAVAMGADYIEPDLVSTRDGVLVARHENEISGTTNVAERFPERRTTKVIDGTTVTGWFTEDFTLTDLRAPVLIQSFEVGNLRRLATMTRVRLIQLMSSGTPPDYTAGGAIPTYAEMATAAGLRTVTEYAYGIGPDKGLVLGAEGTPSAVVAAAHGAGLGVHAWTLRAEPRFVPAQFAGDVRRELRALLELGVDGVFADHPDIAVEVVRSTGVPR